LKPLRAPLALLALTVLLTACSVAGRRESPQVPPKSLPPAPSPSEDVPPPPRDLASIPDAVPKVEPRSKRGNPKFYEVLGKRYFVMPSAAGYVERGIASWYGPTFHGELTSMGEKYDMYAMSAAHKTLPLPVYVRVTNLRNGRSVVVRVNDRGPFVANRIIDLSHSAAAKLDMLHEGTTMVEVRTITPSEAPVLTRAEELPPQTLYAQAGAFADERNARALVERLKSAGVDGAFVQSPPERGSRMFRVRVGPVADAAACDALAARLGALGITDVSLAGD
jgi:rare lipoprotein A